MSLICSFSGNKDFGSYGYNIYNVKGNGIFDNIYKFVSYIERGPQIHRVTNLTVTSPQNRFQFENDIEVPYNMQVRAYYANLEDLPSPTPDFDIEIPEIRNPFTPKDFSIFPQKPVKKPPTRKVVPQNTEGLLELNGAKLQSIFFGKALITDRKGKAYTLKEGDRIFLGIVQKIDQPGNQVVFQLNKNGSVSTEVLKLEF